VAALAGVAGCVDARPATDAGNTLSPTVVALPAPGQPVAYEPDMRQLFASDCVFCHGGYRADDRYYMRTYEEVTTGVQPGTPTGGLLRTTRPGESMFRYFTGDAQTQQLKSDLVYQWIVTYRAQRTR
jgi:hypothetical protein